jgi:hypothetical protein
VIAARLNASRFGARLRATSAGGIALEGARFLFYVGLPYAALLAGAFAPRDVGLLGSPAPDALLGWPAEAWLRAAGHAAALGGATLLAVAALAWQVRRAGGYTPLALGVEHQPSTRAIRDAVYAETHWSFYRALPMVALADARWAALAGLALAAIEALLAGRRAETGAARIRLSEGLLAGLSATYFAMTGGHAWLAIALQAGVRGAMTQLVFIGRDAAAPDDVIV